ncbi:tetratricopeptide repeat protein [Streptomyces sp. BH-SS-21]|uniref:Tetratricopeptide repeat protein n=1 Tax=Streptomyces liliiviolaceus TaxID=2823109 RepID=A0A940Y1F1_9ACTN|nr:tetratricopeptide repeat protein [Streptomyces liliiviolaceus]MBQ0855559.1 tetratricopeptide repeat protein [Streptomyces liliiviolaceus]
MSAQAGAGGIAIGAYHAVPYGGVPAFPQQWTERPHQIGAIPREADCYQHRTAAAALNQASTTGQPTGTHVLTGTAGVGKTQLAALYVRDAWRSGQLDLLLWINANTRAGVVTVYAQAASELLGADSGSPEQAAVTFLAWLEHKAQAQPCRWLIVLDDVCDPGDLRHLWPPDSPYGRTVITTRRRDAALGSGGRRMVPVGLFEPEEAVAYLSSSLSGHGSNESKDTLAGLARDLGYLPLALSQGVAFMLDAGLEAAAYRKLLADGARNLAELLPEQRTLPDDQEAPMAAAWALSIDHANGLRPEGLARPILQLAAMLDANGIPTEVLTSGPALDHLSASARGRHRRGQQQGECTGEQALGALRALHRLNLIDHTPGGIPQGVRVHQLIQRTVRDALAGADYERLVWRAADALTAVWPDIERDTGFAQTLRANTAALMLHGQETLYRPHVHPVLHCIGRSLGKTGQVSAARDYFEELTHTLQQHCGPDHLDTLLARGRHARWRGEAGDASGAADETADLLRDTLRVLGQDHSYTLTTLSNLARWRGEAGDPEGAATATAELLRDRTRILGTEHELTLSTRSNLQYWRGRTGNPADAAAATGELLEDMLRILGPDHPYTLTARSHLAHVRGRAGEPKAAAAATAELLEDQERILGPDHPDTLTTRHELARWHGEAGDALGAASLLTTLLKDRSRVLGPDHPRTLATRSNLACWRSEAGDRESAVSLTEKLLHDMLRILGPHHPYTRIAQANLTRWREQPEGDGTSIPY